MYQRAKDLFVAAGEAERDARVCARRLEALGLPRGGSGISVSRGPATDGSARLAAQIDERDDLERRIAQDAEVTDMARRVLYGEPEGTGGVAALLGREHADCVKLHYIDGLSYQKASVALMLSRRTVVRRCDESLELVDALGMARAIEGVGFAEG
ncbi:MAG: hypothetical protein U0L51_08210 [Olegusella sp.]|nr:hypothetical protein [Olegusella sp.]